MTEPIERPAYHFTAKNGWINDPIGVTFRGGQVDIFFQYVPETTTWQPGCHWGHATSSDLTTWEEHPPALSPGDGDGGCWTGCIVADADLMLYTSVNEPHLAVGRVRAARAVDGTWEEWAKGSFVVDVPDGVQATSFRDPFVWWDDDRWRMLVGGALPGGLAAALTYSSTDLAVWSYDGVFAQRHTKERDGVWSGSLWECPQLVRVGSADYLVVSVWDDDVLHYVACARGSSRGGRFEVAGWQQLTHGSYYAATSFQDDDGHVGLMHWLRGVGDAANGWMGALSVPHRLTQQDGFLVASPHPDIAIARRTVLADRLPLDAGLVLPLPSWHCEVRLDLHPGAGPLELSWGDATDSTARLTLRTDPALNRWTLTSADPAAACSGALLDHPEQLTVLLDGCLAEVFLGASGVAAVPLLSGAASRESGPVLFVSPAVEARLTAWELRPAVH